MAGHSKIEWTEATWNPIAGCSIVSPGCTNCYAMRRVAPRLSANPATPHYAGTVKPSNGGPVWTGKIGIADDRVLLAPLTWTRPRMIFVNSTSDLFHPDVPDEVIDRVFAVMGLAHWHTYQVLTKRPERMRQYFAETWQVPARAAERILDVEVPARAARVADRWDRINAAVDALTLHNIFDHDRFWTKDGDLIGRPEWPRRPLPNVWLGTSVEDQRRADERIPHLLQTPAAVRFISAEPLLGPIDLTRIAWKPVGIPPFPYDALAGRTGPYANGQTDEESGPQDVHLDWVIVGGESGSGARPMHPDWARGLRDQCAAAGVPYFFKQWGNYVPQYDVDINPLYWSAQPPEFADHEVHGGWCFGRRPGQRPWMMFKRDKHAAGRLLDGVEHNAFPEVHP